MDSLSDDSICSPLFSEQAMIPSQITTLMLEFSDGRNYTLFSRHFSLFPYIETVGLHRRNRGGEGEGGSVLQIIFKMKQVDS